MITINGALTRSSRLGVLAHIGQPEYKAGVKAGERLGKAGVASARCA